MKRIYLNLLVAILAVFALSCASAEDEMIVGQWNFANIEEQISDDLKAAGQQTLGESDIENMRQNAKYTFNNNKTYVLDLITFQDNGMWWISENGVTLNMRSEKNSAVGRATIQKLTDNELILVIQVVPQKYMQIITFAKADN